jgi:hypothetical protein
LGKNKQLRKKIAGLLRTILAHQRKIEQELQKPAPDIGFIRKWEKEIDTARKAMRKLEERLER